MAFSAKIIFLISILFLFSHPAIAAKRGGYLKSSQELTISKSYPFSEKRPYHLRPSESLHVKDIYKKFLSKLTSNLHLKTKNLHVVGLKKSSFFNTKPTQFSTPVLFGDRLYVGVDAGYFYAIDVSKGKKIWKQKVDGSVQSKAAVDEKRVYFGTSRAKAYALNLEDGTVAWEQKLDAEILSAPSIDSGKVHFLTSTGRLFALNPDNGMDVWHGDPLGRKFGFTVYKGPTPLNFDGKMIIGTSSGLLAAYNNSGSLVWSRQVGDKLADLYDVCASPVVWKNRLLASSNDGYVSSIDPRSGEVVWNTDANGSTGLLTAFGKLYTSGKDVIAALNPEDGSKIWEQDFDIKGGLSVPAAGDDFLVVVSTIGKLYLMDPENGDIVHSKPIMNGAYSDPVVVGNKIYLLANTGRLFIFEVRKKKHKTV